MNTELKKTLRNISENTGIDLSVFTSTGIPVSSTSGEEISPDFEGILQSGGFTYFKAIFKAEQYIFGIEGATHVQKNYAFLLADMIENSSSRAVNLPKGEFVADCI